MKAKTQRGTWVLIVLDSWRARFRVLFGKPILVTVDFKFAQYDVKLAGATTSAVVCNTETARRAIAAGAPIFAVDCEEKVRKKPKSDDPPKESA